MSHYITVEAEVNLDDYNQEIEEILKGKTKGLEQFIVELEKELTFYREEFWRTPQQILEDLKNL